MSYGVPAELIHKNNYDYCYGIDDSDYSDEDDDYYFGPKIRANPVSITNILEAIGKRNLNELANQIDQQLAKGKSLDYDGNWSSVPLIEACSNRWEDGVALLLERGADPNAQKELSTALFACCGSQSVECTSHLLNNGADVNATNQFGLSPLLWACLTNAESVAGLLLNHPKTNIHAQDPFGRTALFFAEMSGNMHLVEMLIKAGIDPQIRASDGTVASYHRVQLEPETKLYVSYCFDDIPLSNEYSIETTRDAESNKCIEKFISDALGGYPSKAIDLIGINFSGVNLRDVLSGDEEQLKRRGVKLSYYRRSISKLGTNLLLQLWDKTSCVPPAALQENLSLSAIGNIVNGALIQLVFMDGALENFKLRMSTKPPKESQKTVLLQLVDLYVAQRGLKRVLLELQQKLEKVDKCQDIVYTKPPKTTWVALVVTAITVPLRFICSIMKFVSNKTDG